MRIPRKRRFKPFYKQLIALRENIQGRKKVLNFKKQKWEKFIYYFQGTLRHYRQGKSYNQTGYIVSRVPSKWEAYREKRYRTILTAYKKFILFYGGFKKYTMKKFINQTLNKFKNGNLNLFFLKLFESRLDTVLYRSKFSQTMRGARQLISHGKIFVNGKKINSKLFYLKTGDVVSIDWEYSRFVLINILRSDFWPIPPKHLIINYKILQIIYGNFHEYTNVSTHFNSSLNLEKLVVDYIKR